MFTADAEYILWFLATPHDNVPITATGSLSGSSIRGEQVVSSLGDAEHGHGDPGSGARFAVGYWQVEDNPWVPGGIRDYGAEAVVFFVGQRSADFRDASSPTIIRPFFDVNNHVESGFVVAAPGVATGGVTAHAQSQLWGAEANVWKNLGFDYPGTTGSVDGMVGFRYLNLDDRLTIDSASVFNPSPTDPAFLPLAGKTLQASDSFATHNHFYGPQVGISGKWWPAGGMQVEAAFKVAIGDNYENLQIAGGQLLTPPSGQSKPSLGGLLALPSNIGDYHINKFTQVPEIDLKFTCPVASHVTLTAGFTTLYWSHVLRPADQVERGLDIAQIPNFPGSTTAPPVAFQQPGVPFRQSDLWALGITIGVGIKW
jgi:hypothetical protein